MYARRRNWCFPTTLLILAALTSPAGAQTDTRKKKDSPPPLAGPQRVPPAPSTHPDEDDLPLFGDEDDLAPRGPMRRGDWRDRRDGRGGRGGPREGWGPDAPPPPQILAEMDELLRFAAEHFPEEAERLRILREEDPAAFRGAMRRILPRLFRMKEAFERDPDGLGRLLIEDQHLEARVRRVTRLYHEAPDGAARDDLARELRELLGRQWDVRMERRRLELADLQKRLAEQQQRHEQRERRREEMIERRFEHLTGQSDFEW